MTTRLYKNHGKAVGYWEISITDQAELKITHARSLDGKPVTRIHAVKPKNVGRSNETTPSQQAELEMASRIRKQLDRGYLRDEISVTAQGSATNALGLLLPVLATVYEKIKQTAICWVEACAQPKLNGNRALFAGGVLYSRGGKEFNLPHIVNAIEEAGLSGLHLDGEIYLHGMPLQEIRGLCSKLTPESEQLEYHIYDIVDVDSSFFRRFRQCKLLHEAQLPPSGPLQIVETIPVSSHTELIALVHGWVRKGYEGGMLRFGQDGYETGKRSRKLLKLKTYTDAEAEVIGFERRSDNIIAGKEPLIDFVWICKNPFGEGQFAAAAAGNWQEVHDQWPTAKDQIGRQLNFKYFELSNDRIPQQPIALDWRDE